MRIRTRRIRASYRKVKPILLVKIGVSKLPPFEIGDYCKKIKESMDFDNLRKEGYIPFLIPTIEINGVSMEIL